MNRCVSAAVVLAIAVAYLVTGVPRGSAFVVIFAIIWITLVGVSITVTLRRDRRYPPPPSP